MQKIIVLLVTIIFLGGVLRVHMISKESLSVNEACVVFASKLSLSESLSNVASLGHLPAYFILMRFWIKIFGDNHFSIRVVSLFCGVASIFFVYKLAKILFKSNMVALISSFIFSLSVINIYYAQEANVYALGTLCALLSTILLIKTVKENKKLAYLYMFVIAVLIYTHIFNLLVISIHALFILSLLLRQDNDRREKIYFFLPWLIGISLLYIPAAILLFKHFEVVRLDSLPTNNYFFGDLLKIVQHLSFKIYSELPMSTNMVSELAETLGASLFMILVFYGTYACFKKNNSIHAVILCNIWFFLPVVLMLLASNYSGFHPQPRLVLHAGAPYYMLVANGLVKIKRKAVSVIFILLLCIIAALTLFRYYSVDKKSNWRSAIDYISGNIADDETLICITDEHRPNFPEEGYFLRYYYHRAFKVVGPGMDGLLLSRHLSGAWQIGWKQPESAEYINARYLGSKFTIIDIQKFDNITVSHFRIK